MFVAVLAVLLFSIAGVFWFVDDEDVRKKVLNWLDMLVPFVLGAGSGGAAGALSMGAGSDPNLLGGYGPHLTYQIGTAVICLIVSIALMIARSKPGGVREKLLGYISAVLPFLLGLGAGGGGALLMLG